MIRFQFCFLVFYWKVEAFLHFDNNTFIDQLPSGHFYTFFQPKPVSQPHLINLNEELMKTLSLSTIDRSTMAQLLSGNQLFSGSKPVAMAYAGHQFGYFTSQLGDGRAVLLGQMKHWAFHAKGTGPTAYSRGGDGRAVLRSSIREYLISEAMFHLGIETTRALSLVGSVFERVYRESVETAAVVVRVAPIVAFIRFGTFELFSSRHQTSLVRQLADFVIENMYNHSFPIEKPYESLFFDITDRTAKLVAHWQAFGFTHGVLNTDNMNVIGSTIDYGPFGFVEDRIFGYVPNHSDDEARYAFDRQPSIAAWNLGQLRQAFQSLLSSDEPIDEQKRFWSTFNRIYDRLMREKLGLIFYRNSDRWLYEEILRLLDFYRLDYTRFWRNLSNGIVPEKLKEHSWFRIYQQRCFSEGSYANQIRSQRMKRINPKYILRTYMAQVAIEKAQQGNFNEIDRLLNLLRHPFEEQVQLEKYAEVSPAWAKKLILSCSS